MSRLTVPHPTQLLRGLSGPRSQKRPLKVAGCGLGHDKKGGCAFLELPVGCFLLLLQGDSGCMSWVVVSHPKRPFSRCYSGPRSQRGPSSQLEAAQGMESWIASPCWGSWLVVLNFLCGPGRFGGWELGGSHAPKAALFRCYSGPRSQGCPSRQLEAAQGMARWIVSICWGCWLVI